MRGQAPRGLRGLPQTGVTVGRAPVPHCGQLGGVLRTLSGLLREPPCVLDYLRAVGIFSRLIYSATTPTHPLTHANPPFPGFSAMTTLGEEEFNKIETAVLDQVQAYYGTVVSTGSIAPVFPNNWSKFRTGLVFE